MSHLDLLKRLLPSAFDANDELLGHELVGESNALDKALLIADRLLLEADPRTADMTFTDWERVYDLPDRCVTAAGIRQSMTERREALVSLVGLEGGQDIPFFIMLAAALGYTITITEYTPYTTEMDTEQPVTDEPYRFVWKVNSALGGFREFSTEDDTETPLATWGNTLLECRLKRFKPSHTHIIFSYS